MNSIIDNNRYLTLATSDGRGDVWIAPLAYVYDASKGYFYFYSDKNSKHCCHITENPHAAIAVFDSQAPSEEAQGLQMHVIVEPVKRDDLPNVMKLYYDKSFPNKEERSRWERPIENFQGQASQRFYQIRPLEAFVNIQNDMVDCRKGIEL